MRNNHPTLSLLLPLISLMIAEPAYSRGVDTIIAGDSYSAGTVGIYLEKLFTGRSEKVGRYGISSSFVKHWYERSPSDKTVGPGVGVDWVSPGREGSGHAPSDFPKLRSILEGEANAKKVVIILGTNGLCSDVTVRDAGLLAAQVREAKPNIQCFWVGPKLFTGECEGDIQRQKKFSLDLERALGPNCSFINSTLLPIRVGEEPHNGDFASEWAKAVGKKF